MTSDRQYDYDLVDRYKAGDQTAFTELYERHRDKVFRVAYKVVLNTEDALDVAQDTFVTAHRALHKFERRAAVSTWLCQIAVHRAIDFTRKKRAKTGESLEYQLTAESTKLRRGQVVEGDANNPADLVSRSELVEKLHAALEILGEKHRIVFVLYSLNGLSYKEISDELDISMGTVMSRLFYARKKLQSILGDVVKDLVAERKVG